MTKEEMTKETIIEEMERCLIPLSLMNNREHQEFIKSALMGNLSKLAEKLVKESASLPPVMPFLKELHNRLETEFDKHTEEEKDEMSEIVKMCEAISEDYWMYKRN